MTSQLTSPQQQSGIQQPQQSNQKAYRYTREMNPTFQSQLINMVMAQPFEQEHRDRRRKFHQQTSSTNYVDQLDLATRAYEKRRISVQNPEQFNGPVTPQPQSTAPKQQQPPAMTEYLQPKPLPFELRSAEPTASIPLAKLRSQSIPSLPTFAPNDESIFTKQYKPYNIITNNPHAVTRLRMHPKLSTEFKRQTYFENYMQMQQSKTRQ